MGEGANRNPIRNYSCSAGERGYEMNMKETMEQELAEAIATLEKANGALSRIFGIEQEGESDE
jgi:hypothetical protein